MHQRHRVGEFNNSTTPNLNPLFDLPNIRRTTAQVTSHIRLRRTTISTHRRFNRLHTIRPNQRHNSTRQWHTQRFDTRLHRRNSVIERTHITNVIISFSTTRNWTLDLPVNRRLLSLTSSLLFVRQQRLTVRAGRHGRQPPILLRRHQVGPHPTPTFLQRNLRHRRPRHQRAHTAIARHNFINQHPLTLPSVRLLIRH